MSTLVSKLMVPLAQENNQIAYFHSCSLEAKGRIATFEGQLVSIQ